MYLLIIVDKIHVDSNSISITRILIIMIIIIILLIIPISHFLCLIFPSPKYSYMFDEPSSYLDVKQRLKAARVIRSLLKTNTYVIISFISKIEYNEKRYFIANLFFFFFFFYHYNLIPIRIPSCILYILYIVM